MEPLPCLLTGTHIQNFKGDNTLRNDNFHYVPPKALGHVVQVNAGVAGCVMCVSVTLPKKNK